MTAISPQASPAARRLLTRWRLRAALCLLLWLLPGWALLRFAGAALLPTVAIDVALLLALLIGAVWILRRFDAAALAQRLNARRAEFEDSAGLLFEPGATALAPLQRARIEARLPRVALSALGPRLLRPLQLLPPVLAAGLLLGLWLLQPGAAPAPAAGAAPTEAIDAGPPTLRSAEIHIEPPAYTGLESRTSSGLDVEAVQDARLSWSLQIAPAPTSAALVFIDGERVELAPEADRYVAELKLAESRRYRLEIDGQVQAGDEPAARLDMLVDSPPVLQVRRPGQTLTVVDSAAPLQLEIEASDDYGLGPASLSITLASGDGEVIEVREQRIALRGEGDARSRRYRPRIDPLALGFVEASDLILRVEVSDTRAPQPQTTRSSAYILRWPKSVDAEGSGVEGFIQRTLPAYFRSQRQIIIDTEALIEAQPQLSDAESLSRSDAIGVDQRLLRLRYGEFLGEETEDAGSALPEGHSYDDGHGHAPPPPGGEARAIIESFGHVHDESEAATLFDPVTRERLRKALGEMWQSELNLRSGQPRVALPHQYRALDLIKQIQQASRIYLARVGLELPPIDFSRRLSGKLEGARAPRDPLQAAERADAPLRALHRALANAQAEDRDQVWSAFQTWLEQRPVADTLDLREQAERVRRDPQCEACVARLRAALWAQLTTPPQAGVARDLDDRGRAWLKAQEASQ
jgi:hypothetical protein